MTFLLTVVLAWFGFVVVWYLVRGVLSKADADKIKQRLQGAPKQSAEKKKETGAVSKPLIQTEDKSVGQVTLQLLRRFQLHDRLRELLEQSGLRWNVARLMHACLACFIAGYLVVWMLTDLRSLALLIAAGCAFLPIGYVLKKRAARLRKFEELFPESLEFVARSMRAGHAFSVSLEMIHREFQEPLAGEFRRTFEEHNLGLPLDAALQKLAKRVPLLDVQFFVSAVLLQKRTGGNLAEILDKLAYVIRERFKLRGRIRAVSAHGRMTGTALSLIPVVVGIILIYVNSYYAEFFFRDEIGHYMLGGAVALQLIGYAIIKKIVTIEV
ncbi:MAG: type II secretion system F family protein [Bryobacteraceae bacterium]|nr:type II secretion system F family protein [Bryobacteraceae bacterium]MDW8378559.1 type II secretion system F family protein [Bryobacterales bacterium]